MEVDRSSNPGHYKGRNCNFWDDMAKIGISCSNFEEMSTLNFATHINLLLLVIN